MNMKIYNIFCVKEFLGAMSHQGWSLTCEMQWISWHNVASRVKPYMWDAMRNPFQATHQWWNIYRRFVKVTSSTSK